MDAENSIVHMLSRDLNNELTIHQISKALKKSYAFTHKYCKKLIKENILNKKKIGNAILCSLNFKNEKTSALLMMNSVNEKIKFISQNEKIKNFLESMENEIEENRIEIVLLSDNNVYLISEFEFSDLSVSNYKINIIKNDDFVKDFRKIIPDFKNIVLLEGYEKFWKIVSRIK